MTSAFTWSRLKSIRRQIFFTLSHVVFKMFELCHVNYFSMSVLPVAIYLEVSDVEGGIEWQGLVAKDKFYVTYHGEVLSKSMEEVSCSSIVVMRSMLVHGPLFVSWSNEHLQACLLSRIVI